MKSQRQRQSAKQRTYDAFVPRYLADHPHCEAAVSDKCKGWSTLCHHRRLRSNTGAWSLDLNVLALCVPCHLHIHANGDESRELGFILTAGPEFDACKAPRKDYL